MKPVSITCPFTGITVKAMESGDKTLFFRNAITREEIMCPYDYISDCYSIPAEMLTQKYDLVSMTHAAYILGVTRQRMTQIARDETIKPLVVGGKTMFARDDVLEYKNKRKVGAPKKE